MVWKFRHILFLAFPLSVFSSLKAQDYLPFNSEGKWGTIDSVGNVVLPPSFSGIGDFREGIAPARNLGKWTLIDAEGVALFPYEYLRIENLKVNDSDTLQLWKAKDEKGWSIINKKNEKLTFSKYEDFSVFNSFYVGQKNGENYIGVLGNKNVLTETYDQVSYKNGYFLAYKEESAIIIDNQLNEIEKGNFTDFSWFNELLLVNYRNRNALFNKRGEELIANCEISVLTENFIAGYDKVNQKSFVFKSIENELVYLDKNITIADSYNEFLIVNSDKTIKVFDSTFTSRLSGIYIDYFKRFNFLNLYKQDNIFDIYNSSLELVATNVDVITRQEEYFLIRKNGRYGLLKNNHVFIPAKYDYFSIDKEKIKAYHNNGLTVFHLENGVIKDQNTYNNVVTIKSYGRIPSNYSRNNASFMQEESNLFGWYSDTLFNRKDSSKYIVKWGIKEDDTSYAIDPVYSSKEIFNDKFSLGYYHRSSGKEIRMVNKIPSIFAVDLVDHQQKVVKNDQPLYNFKVFNSSSNIYFANTKKNYFILNHNFDVLYDDVPYMEQNQSVNRHRFCQNPEKIEAQTEDNKTNYAQPLTNWYSQFVSLFIFGTQSNKWNEGKVEFINARWGYMNDSAKIVIPATYDYTEAYIGNFGIVHNNGLIGAVNKTSEILPTKYRSIDQLQFDNDTLLKVRDNSSANNFWIDTLGNPVESTYQALMNSRLNDNEHLITVKSGTKFGLINAAGVLVVPIELSREPEVKEDYVIVRKRKAGIVDLEGNVLVDFAYSRIDSYKDNRVVFKDRNKLGVGDESGEIIIPAEYKVVKLKNDVIYCENSYGSKIFDWDGIQISNPKWVSADYDKQKDIWIYKKKNKTIVETSEKKYKYSDFNKSVRFMGNYLLVEWERGKFNLHKMDKEHTPIFSEAYDRIEQLNDTVFLVYERNKFGFRSIKDESIIPIRYRNLVEVFDGIYAGIYQNYLKVFNLKGEVLLARKAFEVLKSDNGLFLVKSDNGCVYYNENMENHFFEVYDNATSFKNGYASISRDGFWTTINTYGEELFEPSFGSIVPVASNFFYARAKLHYGLYDGKGNQLLPCEYDHIDRVSGSILRVVQNGNIGYLRVDGKWILRVDD